MALSDVYMATLVQRWGAGGERMLNNFFFEATGTGGSASEVSGLFTGGTGLISKIHPIQCDIVKDELLRVINLGSLTDFIETPLTGVGGITNGLAHPAYVALNYTLRLDTRAVRPGSKRFAGVPENWDEAGVINSAPALTTIDDLRTALGVATEITGTTYTPVVVKRVLHPADETHENPWYALPASDEELVLGHVSGVLVNLHLSHQVSRGNGR